MKNQTQNEYFTDGKGNVLTDLVAIVNSPIVDEYREKVLELTDFGSNIDGISAIDAEMVQAFIDGLGLTNTDDIVHCFATLKGYLASIADEYGDPICDFLEIAIAVAIEELGAKFLVDIGDTTTDEVEMSTMLANADAISEQAELNALAMEQLEREVA